MKKAFLFPGQGAQYQGMGADFAAAYSIAKETFEEADDLLKRNLSAIIFKGPDALLTETRNSQTAIYVVSFAILRVINKLFPQLLPDFAAGLSLGEYTAASAAGCFSFEEGLFLVQHRGEYMNAACLEKKGTMAVILGLGAQDVEEIVKEADLPNDLWAANFNCPGQVVISGSVKGVEVGGKLAKERGAKRVLPLQVHGAFHSGFMSPAKKMMEPHIETLPLSLPNVKLIMNVTGDIVSQEAEIKKNLLEQIISPVKWESGIRSLDQEGVALYIEMGPGKTLSGFNKRIGILGKTVSVEKVEDLAVLEQAVAQFNNT